VRRLLALAPAALLVTHPLLAQTKPQPETRSPLSICQEAEGVPPKDPATNAFSAYQFSIGGSSYRVQSNGRGIREAGTQQPEEFKLAVDSESTIVRIFVCRREANVLLTAEVSDGESGGGTVFLLEGKTLVTKWKTDIPGFNVAAPVVEVDFAYVSGIGFVGCLNLRSGRYRWKHVGLYDNGEYNAFKPAEPDGGQVVFRDKTQSNVLPVVIQKRSGKILSPESVRDRVAHPRKRTCGEYAAPRPC
jgi:hypothetical protein